MFPGTNIIAQIRKYAFGHDQQESAGQAWGKVIKVLKNPEMVWVKVKVSWSDQPQLDRTEKQPDFKSKLIEETVRVMGGLKRMREEEAENPAAVRAHFFRIYEELQEKKNIRELLGEH